MIITLVADISIIAWRYTSNIGGGQDHNHEFVEQSHQKKLEPPKKM